MPLQDLLHQAVVEHETLQSKYDEALVEISRLRTRLDFREDPDTEFVAPQPNIFIEPLHDVCQPESRDAPLQKVLLANSALEKNELQEATEDNDEYLQVGSVAHIRSTQVLRTGTPRQKRVATFLQSLEVESCLVVVVLSNVVVMWIETDRQAAMKEQLFAFVFLNWVYMLLYISEFALRVFVYRRDVFNDVWTRLDGGIIAIDIVSVLFQAAFPNGFLGSLKPQIFRILRVFRLSRIFKFLRFVTELQLLILGFFAVMKAQIFTALILAIVVILWSFVYVEVIHPYAVQMSASGEFGECERCLVAYSSMWHSMVTIWQQVIAGDSWSTLNLDLMTTYPHLSVLIVCCFMTIQFAAMNLIFTVIVDSAARAREENDQLQLSEKELAYEKTKNKLLQMCKVLDKDQNGILTLAELKNGHDYHDAFTETLHSLDITKGDLELMFTVMDEDRSGQVSYAEFVNSLYKMRHQDQHTVLMFIKGYVMDMRYQLTSDIRQLVLESLDLNKANADNIHVLQQHVDEVGADLHQHVDHAFGADYTVLSAAPATESLDAASLQAERAPADSPQCQKAFGKDHVEVERNCQESDGLLPVRESPDPPIVRKISRKKKKAGVASTDDMTVREHMGVGRSRLSGSCFVDIGVTGGAEAETRVSEFSSEPQQYGHVGGPFR